MKTVLSQELAKDLDDLGPVAVETALAQVAGDEIVPYEDAITALNFRYGDSVGDIDGSDIIIPKLNIVNGSGELSEKFKQGQLILDKQQVLAEPGVTINLVVLGVRKWFQEWLPFGTDQRPAIYQTIKEVLDAGKWIEWRDQKQPPARPVASASVLIECPNKDLEAAFPSIYAGTNKRYALALWVMTGTAYTAAAKVLFSARLNTLRAGYQYGWWKLTTSREKKGDFFVYVPILRLGGLNDAAFVDYVTKEVHGGKEK